MTSTNDYDVIVIGIGGMGSATVYELARRGVDVLGLEQFNIPHNNGSSHGITRLIRKAYYEHPSYVPLVNRAFERWETLQKKSEEQLLHITGTIDAGPPGSDVFEGALETCRKHSIQHEVLSGHEASQRFLGYDLPDNHKVLFQPDGGFLHPEKCITAHVEQAHHHGAEIHGRERVTAWEATERGVTVTTPKDEYAADTLVITAGAWALKLIEDLEAHANPEQRVMGWFQPKQPNLYQPDTFPVYIIEVDNQQYYGTPIYDVPGIKVGRYGEPSNRVDPDEVSEDILPEEETVLREFVESCLPAGAGPTLGLSSCLLTNSTDNHYIIDQHPDHDNVVIGAGFSGHGFKLSATVGELLADLTIHGETSYNREFFRIDRF